VTGRPTMHDVAARAGVSIRTVSRVVNDSVRVSDEVRDRVAAAVEELHYLPNSWARSLKAGTGDTIGVVIDTVGDPIFATLTSSVEGIAATERLLALLDGAGGGSGEEFIVQTELVERGSGELPPVVMSR
jgi:LacI family transcriptional regulator